MKTPEQAAADYLAKYEAAGPEGAAGKYLDENERDNLPGAIRAAWRAYNAPETPAEIRDQLRGALDYMIDKL